MANIVPKKGKQGDVRGWEVRTKIPMQNGKPYTFYASAADFERSNVDTFKTLLTNCEIDIRRTGTIQSFALGQIEDYPRLLKDFTEKGIISAAPYTTLDDAIEKALEGLEKTKKERTVKTARNCLRYLLEYFKPETPILKITRRDALAFDAYLIEKVDTGEMAPTSKNSIIGRTKWLFKWFFEQSEERLINPFQSIKGGSTISDKEPRIITKEEAARIEAAILNHKPLRAYYNPTEWLVYFRLGYWQGLRIGSEAPELKWEFIDFEKGTITIKNVKLSKRGKAAQWREMPLYSETTQALMQLKEERKRNGDALVYVFSDWWKKGENYALRRYVTILKEAGLETDRPRQALRQTASNRVDRDWGGRLEQNWIGHSESVARKAYLSKEIPKEILDKFRNREPVATN